MDYHIDVQKEVSELRGVFPQISQSDFYELDNDNVGVIVYYSPDDSNFSTFKILIEYTPGYPSSPPKAWVMNPEISSSTPHTYGTDSNGHMRICFIKPSNWSSNLTSYDAAVMIKTWVYAYCNYKKNGSWDWDEEGFLGHLLP